MFEPEVFRKKMYCIEVLVTLGLFGALRSHLASPAVIRGPENCAPLRCDPACERAFAYYFFCGKQCSGH